MKAAVGNWAKEDGLEDAGDANGVGQFVQSLLVEVRAGLKGIAFDSVEGNFERLAGVFLSVEAVS